MKMIVDGNIAMSEGIKSKGEGICVGKSKKITVQNKNNNILWHLKYM